MATIQSYQQLSAVNQERASAMFVDAGPDDQYWYELDLCGKILCRNKMFNGSEVETYLTEVLNLVKWSQSDGFVQYVRRENDYYYTCGISIGLGIAPNDTYLHRIKLDMGQGHFYHHLTGYQVCSISPSAFDHLIALYHAWEQQPFPVRPHLDPLIEQIDQAREMITEPRGIRGHLIDNIIRAKMHKDLGRYESVLKQIIYGNKQISSKQRKQLHERIITVGDFRQIGDTKLVEIYDRFRSRWSVQR